MATASAATRPPRRFAAGGRPAVDAAVAGGLTLFTLLTLPFLHAVTDLSTRQGLPAYGLVLLAGLATAVRRRHPAAAVLVTSGSVSTYLALSYPYGPVFFFVVLVVYTAARRLTTARAALLSAASYGMLCVHLFTNDAALPGALGLLPALAWIAIPFTVGQARSRVVAAGDRERRAVALEATAAERLRVSQEVHDVVGHGLAAIQMQADIALHVAEQRPDQAAVALRAISRASQQALDDLRETLRTTHPDAASGAVTTPTPGLDRVRDLCDRVSQAGVEVGLTVTGQRRALPTAADVAAYRILQESLTNVVKHAAHPHAEVLVAHAEEEVTVEVTSHDPLVGSHEPGLGITGMQRRAAAVGGRLYAGAGEEPGTFLVRATIPRHLPEEP